MKRNRVGYLIVIAVVIVVGLLSRSRVAAAWPEFLAAYTGDTLWTLMVYLGIGLVFRRLSIPVVALLALGFSFAVEFGQLYRADWIVSLRSTQLGALVLGVRFLWSDLWCYSVGALIGMVGEFGIHQLTTRSRQSMSSPIELDS